MQGCDLPQTVSPARPVDRTDRPRCRRPRPADDRRVPSSWVLHSPPLRYEVASLEHWLDLNA